MLILGPWTNRRHWSNFDRRSILMRSGSTNIQTLLLPALVVCALLTTLASSPARGECPLSTEEGTDRPGGAVLQSLVIDLAGCRQACAANALCKAYTHLHNTHECFLKSSLPDAVPSDCCTSGAKGVWRSGPYSISALDGTNKKFLGTDRASTHVCVLTRVSGKFMGGGESLRVVVRKVGSRVFVGGSKRSATRRVTASLEPHVASAKTASSPTGRSG